MPETTSTNPPVRSFRDLIVWQRAMELAEESVRFADRLPARRLRGLRDQIERSAASIPANIAEGNGKQRTGDYLRYLSIANGSLMELQTHVELAARVGLADAATMDRIKALSEEVSRMLRGLVRSLERSRA
jgi:four helix bundle protein